MIVEASVGLVRQSDELEAGDENDTGGEHEWPAEARAGLQLHSRPIEERPRAGASGRVRGLSARTTIEPSERFLERGNAMRELLGLFLGPPRASKCVHGLYLHAADRGIGLIGEILEHVVEQAQLELLHAGDDGSHDRLGREPELRPESDLWSRLGPTSRRIADRSSA